MKNKTIELVTAGLIFIGIILLIFTSQAFSGLAYYQGALIYPLSVIVSLVLRTLFKRRWVAYLPAIGLFILGVIAIIRVSIDKNTSSDDFGLSILAALGIIFIMWAVVLSGIMFLLNRYLFPLNHQTLSKMATISRWMILLLLPVMIIVVYYKWAEPLSNINHFAVIAIQIIIMVIMAFVSFLVIHFSKQKISLPLQGSILFILAIIGTLIFNENDLASWTLIASMAFLECLFMIDTIQKHRLNSTT